VGDQELAGSDRADVRTLPDRIRKLIDAGGAIRRPARIDGEPRGVEDRPRPATETATPMEALEIIRRMAVRHGDDQIASELNRLGQSPGKGKWWNQTRVATARRNYSITGQKRAVPDPERVSLNEAAWVCGVSHRTIERLAEAGLLQRDQATPRAPWEIRRADLDGEPVRSLHLRRIILPERSNLSKSHWSNQWLAD
jgi:hypothetical protein